MTEDSALLEVRRAGLPAAPVLAALHGACFPDQAWPERPWDESTMVELMTAPGSLALLALRDGQPLGFALARVAADEAEVLSLGVLPAQRGRGVGRALIEALCRLADVLGAGTLHLEVAADNAAALALYRASGFEESGRRRGYYRRRSGPPVDALLLRRGLP